MILVDTSIWVRASRSDGASERTELRALIDRDEVATTEVVVAEILQGARSESDFTEWQETLEALHFFPADRSVWEKAAKLAFDLRRSGMETALSDLVIATVAIENDLEVYTSDSDFERVPGLSLHVV